MLAILFLLSVLASVIVIARAMPGYTYLIWVPFALLMQLGFLAVMYGLLVLLDIGLTLQYGIFSNALLVAILGLRVSRSERNQHSFRIRWQLRKFSKPMYSKRDLIVWAIVLLMCTGCYFAQFGFPPTVSFYASDAAAHTILSYRLSQGEVVGAQYLSYLFTGCLMACFDFAIDRETSYIVFEIAEAILLFMSGASFYSLLAAICKEMKLFPILVFVVLYLAGYPLSNMIYGFSYLGISVTCICMILFVWAAIPDVSGNLLLKGCVISILLFELITSYSLFVPPIYLAVFILLVQWLYRQGSSIARSILSLAGIFAIPICFGYLIVFSAYFVDSGNTVDAVIASEGGIFRDLYASFIFVAPLAFYGFVRNAKEHKLNALTLITVIFLIYSIALFALCAFDRVSTYYFYKTYFVLWLLFFVNAAFGVQRLLAQSLSLVVCYALTWLLVLFLALSGLDTKLSTSRSWLNPNPVAGSLFSVYESNLKCIDERKLSAGTIELLRTAKDLKDDGYKVALTTNDSILRWWSALYEGSYYDFMWWGYADEDMISELENYDYVLVSFADPVLGNALGHTYMDALENAEGYDYDDPENVLMENDDGAIVHAPKRADRSQ